jgi:hypothetical protein
MGHADLPPGPSFVHQVHRAPIGDLRNRQPRHVAQRLLVIERGHQGLGGAGQELVAPLGHPLARDVLDDCDRRHRVAVLIVQRRRLQPVPAERAGRPPDRAQNERLGRLARKQPDRRDRVHRDLASLLVVHHVVLEDRLGRLALHVLQRGETHPVQCRPVCIEDVVMRVADRHRLGERVQDLAEAGTPTAQLRLELAQKPGTLRDVMDPGVEDRLAVFAGRRH